VVGFKFSEDWGKLAENIVALKLKSMQMLSPLIEIHSRTLPKNWFLINNRTQRIFPAIGSYSNCPTGSGGKNRQGVMVRGNGVV